MATINTALQNVNKLDLAKEAMAVVSMMRNDIVLLNQGQMLDGERKDGRYLPRYVDDPYFKSQASALRYQAWKKNISPSKTKPEGVMDFFINGAYHSTLKMSIIGKDYYELLTDSRISQSVDSKTSGSHLGLNPKSVGKLIEKGFFESLMTKVKAVTKFE